MPVELERLEDRLAPAQLPLTPAAAPLPPAAAEALLDPLLTRLGPRQEVKFLVTPPASHPAPAALTLAALDALEEAGADDIPADRPTPDICDELMTAELPGQASQADGAA